MVKQSIDNIKEYILQSNPYLTKGFSEVVQNPDRGIVISKNTPIFPSDVLGNYFYLRLPTNIEFINDQYFSISDNINGVGASVNIVLVVVMNGGNPDGLIKNMINTLQSYTCKGNITFNNAIYIKEEVIRQELSFMEANQIDKAIANVDRDCTIVSLSFTLQINVEFNNCLENPCNC